MIKKTHAEYVERVAKLTKEEYVILEKYIDSKTKILTRHVLCGHEWKISPNKFLIGRRCPKCARKSVANRQRKNISTLRNEIDFKTKSEFELVDKKYINTKSKIIILHKKCNRKFKMIASNFLSRLRCPLCSQEKRIYNSRKTQNAFVKEIYKIYQDEYSVVGKYYNSKEKILMRHNVCGNEWMVRPTNILRNHGCPHCIQSKGEKKIADILNKQEVLFIAQKTFPNCVGVNHTCLKFDFCVYNNQNEIAMLIEYQGEQHYSPIKFFGGKEKFLKTKMYDVYKKYFCQKNKIKLLIISYLEFHDIDNILVDLLTSI